MLNGEIEQKRSVHFFAIMLALSLCMHTALCIFFYCIGVTILYVFNITSVAIYLLLLFLVSRVKHMERWMLVPFAEVLVHVLLCNLCLGWGYGFSLYGFMLMPMLVSSPAMKVVIICFIVHLLIYMKDKQIFVLK